MRALKFAILTCLISTRLSVTKPIEAIAPYITTIQITPQKHSPRWKTENFCRTGARPIVSVEVICRAPIRTPLGGKARSLRRVSRSDQAWLPSFGLRRIHDIGNRRGTGVTWFTHPRNFLRPLLARHGPPTASVA